MYNSIAEGFPNGFWQIAHHVYANVYNGAGIFLLFLWRRRTKSVREKRQALVLILGAFGAIISTLITDFVMGNAGLPTLTPFLTLIWGGSIFLAFSRFNFLKTSPPFISKEILTQSPDLTILFDRDLNLLYSNRNEVLEKIDYTRIRGNPGIEDFFEDGEQLTEKIRTLISGESKILTSPVVLKVAPDKKALLQGCFSLITDEYDSFGGVLFSGKSLISSDRFKKKWGLTPREYEVLQLLAAGKTNGNIAEFLEIAERTVKSHIGSMLLKTKTKSRLELVQLYNADRSSEFP
jgi:DNA-binding CsgD family transcriptional regulator